MYNHPLQKFCTLLVDLKMDDDSGIYVFLQDTNHTAGPVSAEYFKDIVLIQELVSSEGQLGPTLRFFFVSNAL